MMKRLLYTIKNDGTDSHSCTSYQPASLPSEVPLKSPFGLIYLLLGMERQDLFVSGKHSATELHSQSFVCWLLMDKDRILPIIKKWCHGFLF